MILRLNMSGDTPIYEQLRNEIVLGIASGKLLPGESLPTVRQMAENLGINTMTVNKSYALLKEEGYIEIDRRHGAMVSMVQRKESTLSAKALEQLRMIVAETVVHQVERAEFEKLCSQFFSEMKDYQDK